MTFLLVVWVKFPHSPILHYAFSSWIEETMPKTIHRHWENRFGGCPGVPVHGGIPIVFISIHGVVTQFVNV